MTQPPHVPLQETDRVRPSSLLPPPGAWYQQRPAEWDQPWRPAGPRFGFTGPDLGYGLKLASRFEDKLQLAPGEQRKDAFYGGFLCGTRRAAEFGRAPVIYDMDWAYTLWGYLGDAPEDLVAWRVPLFRGAAEAYWAQRQIVDAVRPETLRLTPAQVRERVGSGSWQDLLIV
jgi:hypothetical protein